MREHRRNSLVCPHTCPPTSSAPTHPNCQHDVQSQIISASCRGTLDVSKIVLKKEYDFGDDLSLLAPCKFCNKQIFLVTMLQHRSLGAPYCLHECIDQSCDHLHTSFDKTADEAILQHKKKQEEIEKEWKILEEKSKKIKSIFGDASTGSRAECPKCGQILPICRMEKHWKTTKCLAKSLVKSFDKTK